MSLIDELEALGVNTQEGLGRMMNKAALYEKLLGKYPAAARSSEVMPFFEAQDHEGALAAAHTLKGVTGNLSLTPLYKGYTDIVSLLRENKPEEARKILEEILPIEAEIISCIEKNAK